jgi:hypothetical protein
MSHSVALHLPQHGIYIFSIFIKGGFVKNLDLFKEAQLSSKVVKLLVEDALWTQGLAAF